MKQRFFLCAVFGAIVASSLLSVQVVQADDAQLTQEQQTAVVQTCVAAQTVLQRIQHNDAATRVNRGQGYETLISRLMTPLNSRSASQGHNASAALLIDTTNHYQRALENFKDHYQEYDNSLTSALRTKCQKQPAKFYGYLEDARQQRLVVAGDVNTLANHIAQYRSHVLKLKSEVQ